MQVLKYMLMDVEGRRRVFLLFFARWCPYQYIDAVSKHQRTFLSAKNKKTAEQKRIRHFTKTNFSGKNFDLGIDVFCVE